MRRKRVVIAIVVVVAAAIAASFAIAGGVGDNDEPLTGANLQKATTAATAHTGGGTVVETEIGDNGAAYGVEVRLTDGRTVEVELDENFQVVGQANDDDGQQGEDSGQDDD